MAQNIDNYFICKKNLEVFYALYAVCVVIVECEMIKKKTKKRLES